MSNACGFEQSKQNAEPAVPCNGNADGLPGKYTNQTTLSIPLN